MLSLPFRRVATALVFAAVLLPMSDLHAVPRAKARKEKPAPTRTDEPPATWVGKIISVLWEAAGLRIDDNGLTERAWENAGLRIDDNG